MKKLSNKDMLKERLKRKGFTEEEIKDILKSNQNDVKLLNRTESKKGYFQKK